MAQASSEPTSRQRLGSLGEARAARWYRNRGYRILARNWRCREGELDVVAVRGPTVVFCEVKTRSSDAFGSAVEAVTRSKQARVRRAAKQWLATTKRQPLRVRFDVAAIDADRITVVRGAF